MKKHVAENAKYVCDETKVDSIGKSQLSGAKALIKNVAIYI
jgi:hypothetical protein